jgi:hypothetical protein
MLPADADANPSFPSFGLLGSTAAFVPIPVGNATVKLSRTVGNEVVYAPPPAGHGLGVAKWDKDPLAGPSGYAVKLPTPVVRQLVSVRQWRGVYAGSFPDGAVSHRNTPAVKQLTEFARGLLTHAAALHERGWRLGLLSPDSAYLSTSDPALLFLPDLGFAWVGQMALTKPAWLGTEPTDLQLWGEERKLRQFAAPDQYRTRHPAANNPAELVQQDLRVVGQVLAFMLTGHVGGGEPSAARRCPVWATIRTAAAGKFTDAGQMLEHLLTGLKVPPPSAAPVEEPKGGAGKWVAVVLVLLVLAGAGVGIWWLMNQGNAVASGTPTDAGTPTEPSTSTESPPPPITPKPPDPEVPPTEIVELAKTDPQNPKVLAELDRLRKAKREVYAAARGGAADAARLARDLQDQIDRIVKAQSPSPEAPK